MKEIKIEIKRTQELTAEQMLEILNERIKVFVVEQQCPYQEVDHKDSVAEHVILTKNGQMAAYSRIVPHDDPNFISFGRVLVVKEYRRQHLAVALIEAVLKEIERINPKKPIQIAAQSYLQDFYQSFGFRPVSEVYLEDGISHIDLVLNAR
ncbi:GNAT family N-acetyltransferase [Xylocopilactobacillus apicola]|uniref:Acetyltransferase n=1 Tax=Xylocopilactobacillus apicola TaxID=2932184 RepID=A0AAU9D5S4_9LACO|nr:GNAT family N-acetyltransferase [Xylocopilactobacillus apicola]BDR58873.1 acetyltransferase [Xylocopilactobacillus apicola]